MDIPFEVVEKAMLSDQIIKIADGHTIRTKSVNERYAYNVTDELEAWIDETYPDINVKLIEEMKARIKKKMRVNKEIMANIATAIYSRINNGK